jgi:hypothetical protein
MYDPKAGVVVLIKVLIDGSGQKEQVNVVSWKT